MRTKLLAWCCGSLTLLGAIACASRQPVFIYTGKMTLASSMEESLKHFDHDSEFGSALVGLAISGGGSRAAYLSAAILREINRTNLALSLPREPEASPTTDLLDEIDFISAVSGGSMSAAYFLLKKDALQAEPSERVWRKYVSLMALDYRRRQWILHGVLNPATWVRLLFTRYNRGVIARRHYDRVLYNEATLGDLPKRPVLFINTSDVFNDVRFLFSQRQPYPATTYAESPSRRNNVYDLWDIDVDPKNIPLADGVYASSAFPFAYPVYPLVYYDIVGFGPPEREVAFLADGGLLDNSGLLTLFEQLRGEVRVLAREAGGVRPGAVVCVLYIDAGIGKLRFDMLAEDTYRQEYARASNAPADDLYAWKGTYVTQGMKSIDVATRGHVRAALESLRARGVRFVDPLDPWKLRTLTNRRMNSANLDGEWHEMVRTGALDLPPVVMPLSLEHAEDCLSNLPPGDHRLDSLLAAAHVARRGTRGGDSDGRPRDVGRDGRNEGEGSQAAASAAGGQLMPPTPEEIPVLRMRPKAARSLRDAIARITTDFVLTERDSKVLDVTAYALVNGCLKPMVDEWNDLLAAAEGAP